MNKHRIKQLFTEVANKARESIESGNVFKPEPGIVTTSLLVRSGLIFHAEMADLFFRNVDEASELAKTDPTWSKSAIDRIFSEGLGSVSSGMEVSEAANDLLRKLGLPPRTFRLRFSIFGLGEGCEGTQFGKMRIGMETVTPSYDFGPLLKKDVDRNLYYAEIEAKAVDIDSAKLRAESLIDRHLSILDILCADGSPSRSYLSRRFIGMHDFSLFQEQTDDGWSGGTTSSLIRRPLMPDEWKKILTRPLWGSLSELFRSEIPFAEHLLNSLEMAGGTFREQAPHNAFLLLVVALESALMGGKSEQEIANQFAVRAALLSNGTADERRALYKRIKRLYKLRSAIVHRGSKSITDRDLVEMREVCLGCLVVLCTSQNFSSIRTVDDLDAWFLERMLSAPDPSFGDEVSP